MVSLNPPVISLKIGCPIHKYPLKVTFFRGIVPFLSLACVTSQCARRDNVFLATELKWHLVHALQMFTREHNSFGLWRGVQTCSTSSCKVTPHMLHNFPQKYNLIRSFDRYFSSVFPFHSAACLERRTPSALTEPPSPPLSGQGNLCLLWWMKRLDFSSLIPPHF